MSMQWIAGINPVAGALANDVERVRELLVEQGNRNARVQDLAAEARRLGVLVRQVSRAEIERAVAGVRHQGIAAAYEAPAVRDEHDLVALAEGAGRGALFLVLDGVTDPHNLGACLRSAAAANITAVIVPRDRAAGITPVARRASAGGADRVPLVEVTNLSRALRALKDAGVWLVGLDGTGAGSIHDQDLVGPIALVLGGEGEGMRRLTRETCDFVVRIPMPGPMESLNVSVATGIALFEALRQRGVKA